MSDDALPELDKDLVNLIADTCDELHISRVNRIALAIQEHLKTRTTAAEDARQLEALRIARTHIRILGECMDPAKWLLNNSIIHQKVLDELDAAIATVREHDKAHDILVELWECKKLKEEIEVRRSAHPNVYLHNQFKHTPFEQLLKEYNTRKPAAWERVRKYMERDDG